MKIRIAIVASLIALGGLLAACGGGGSSHSAMPASLSSAAPAGGVGGASTVRFTLKIPAQAPASWKRLPAWISPSGQGLAVYAYPGAASPAPSATPIAFFNVSPTSPLCASSGTTRTCTVSLSLPPGATLIDAVLYDASSLPTPLPTTSPAPTAAPFNALATATLQTTILANAANPVTLVLDGIPATLSIGTVKLNNPTTPTGTTTSQPFTVPVTAMDADGNVIMTDPYASPINVQVYGPSGVVSPASPQPIVNAGASSAAFTYSGGFFANPMVAVANDGNASMTAQIFGANAPPCSYSATAPSYPNPQATPPKSPVWDDNLYHASFGIAGAPLQAATLDTGSTGIQAGLSALAQANMSQVIGPGQPFSITLFPSGVQNIGHYYLAPVTIGDANQNALGTTVPMEIEVVEQTCSPSSGCKSTAGGGGPSYMGIGFDRATNSSSVLGLPLENPLLQLTSVVTPANPAAAMHPGYTISTSTMNFGLTASNTANFQFEPLTPSTSSPGDWNGATGCVAFNSGTCQTASVLVDIGQSAMLLNGLSYPNPVNKIAVAVPNATSPYMAYSFPFPSPSGTPPAPNPNVANTNNGVQFLSTITNPFANFGVNAIAAADYLYDSACGRVGFAPPSGT